MKQPPIRSPVDTMDSPAHPANNILTPIATKPVIESFQVLSSLPCCLSKTGAEIIPKWRNVTN
jgi:hypothetical protein